jgi:homoisocitrate dehydrogenase
MMDGLRRIALIPGDGVGQEVVPAAARVVDALRLPIAWVPLDAGFDCFQRTGTALPDATLAALDSCEGAIFGAVSSPSGTVEGYASPILTLRNTLGLYANLRPIHSMPVAGSRPNIDMLIVRENTECLYVKRERISDDGEEAIAERVITRSASQRIARRAFEAAIARGKQQPLVTIVHKANVLAITDGLFRSAALAVAAEYPQVRVEEQLVDSMIYRMIREPERYDVIVAPNLYGDILSDAAAALVGGLGVAPSANVGDGFVLVEPVHGSAPDIAGKGIANPIATILAAAMLLDHLGAREQGSAIREAVNEVLAAGVLTADLGGSATTAEVTQAIIAKLTQA